ncbi:MAG: hypothetical protein MZV65_34470 [Chromatiales bacterium]|nr:hypothetical protein [Chromatiales bacterium]
MRDGGVRGTVIMLQRRADARSSAVGDATVRAEAGVAERQARALQRRHRAARRRVPGRHPGHGRRRAGDERRRLRRRDLADRRPRSRPSTATASVATRTPGRLPRSATAACAARPATNGSWPRDFALRPPATPPRARRASSRCWPSAARRQPTRWPNAGSVFRNPPGRPRGAADRAAGLKGCALGGAQRVGRSTRNFIVNNGDGHAPRDIEAADRARAAPKCANADTAIRARAGRCAIDR